MLISLLINLLVSNAVNLLRDKSILFSRILYVFLFIILVVKNEWTVNKEIVSIILKIIIITINFKSNALLYIYKWTYTYYIFFNINLNIILLAINFILTLTILHSPIGLTKKLDMCIDHIKFSIFLSILEKWFNVVSVFLLNLVKLW